MVPPMVALRMRFYEPTAGQIILDGKDPWGSGHTLKGAAAKSSSTVFFDLYRGIEMLKSTINPLYM